MTFIHTKRSTFPFAFIAFCAALPVLMAVIWLIVIYNNVVDLRHQMTSMNTELKDIQTKTAELKEKELALLGEQTLSALATRRSLVAESNPRYLEISRSNSISQAQWAAALPY